MLKTKIKSIALAFAITLQVLVPAAFADFLNVRAYGTDTVAGYASMLKSSMLSPNKEIIFVVEKPDSSIVRVSAQSDLEGIARADLYGHQTKLAGVYKVALVYPGTTEASPQNTFTVYPDQVSKTQSMVSSTTQMVEADGTSRSFITVTLYDAYRNPIRDHQVRLISSRPEDDITAINTGITDESGRASFRMTSKNTGVSVLSAMDASANTVLQDREEVVFYAPTPKAVGGNFFSTSALQADIINAANAQEVLPGPVDHFDIEDLPSTVKVNTDQTLTIVARDKDGNIAKNYTGTVLISTPDDENAVLPNNGEYTFKEADQGKFTFNLAFRFSQVGQQFIQILDKDNWKIAGEKEVEVIPQQAITVPDVTSSLSIKSPVDGGKFGSNLVVITGQGDPNINLKIFDDDVKIGDTETDSDGFFSFQAKGLAAGSHTFYVMSGSGQVSKSVTINVDTLPPVLNSITISPSGVVQPGQTLKVVISSEPNLDEVRIRIQGVEKELLPEAGQPGTYTISITAPANAGSYPVDVILADDLANRSEMQAQKTILVEAEAVTLPPTVTNPEGIAGDSEVLLTWDAVSGHITGIAGYKVSYGISYENLDQTAQTEGNATSLKIANLQNGTQYFFAVKAVDSKGLESAEPSTVIAVTPVSPAEAVKEEGAGEGLQPSAPETGTGMPPASLYNNPLIGTASSNTISLIWQPFPGVSAARYKIYFGLNSGQYDDYTATVDNSTTAVVNDLINNVPYYFAVVALNYAGNEISPLSAELQIAPSGSGFQSLPAGQVTGGRATYVSPLSNMQFANVPAQEATGPATTWIVIIAITLAGGIFYLNKRRLLVNR
ncbi:Ig-like domain-containing protein [Patescibacteria group bacterium]|nr:Ig-like domain-containing protein [Patescibacteria group bacterium]MBU1015666.1 Ig-like domain-containing protein [Patescibacteria group bacterium]MBU1685624.1 Ig-like domain-containing protein [Patescibacteria group bacterium]MBU1938993.1 Ig-like domain-containing protein [Patescibacteria group bacterium]